MKNYITPMFDFEVVEDMIVTSLSIASDLNDLPDENYTAWGEIFGA